MTLFESAQLLGNVGAFVGAIAVLVMLVYLAVQLRQNASQLRSNSRQGWFQAISIRDPDQSVSTGGRMIT